MRLFIAIDVPEEIKEKAERINQEIKALPGSFTFVDKEAMHITLNFIGEVDDSLAKNAIKALDEVSFFPFEVALKGLSYFSPSFIRVIYIPVSEGNGELSRLFSIVGEALQNESVPYEHSNDEINQFKAHLTMARVKYIKEKKPLLDIIAHHSNDEFGKFKVESIALKQSTLTEKGPIYKDLYRIVLGKK